MIKEWATVVSWHNGVAQVHCDVKASCSSCASRAGCGSRVLNKLGPQTSHTISVPCEQPLAAGQKVELGIAESSLLGSAMLVYGAAGGAVCNGVYFSGAVCQRYCVTLRRAAGRRRRLPGGARSVAATGGTSVPAAGDFERRTAAGSAAC